MKTLLAILLKKLASTLMKKRLAFFLLRLIADKTETKVDNAFVELGIAIDSGDSGKIEKGFKDLADVFFPDADLGKPAIAKALYAGGEGRLRKRP